MVADVVSVVALLDRGEGDLHVGAKLGGHNGGEQAGDGFVDAGEGTKLLFCNLAGAAKLVDTDVLWDRSGRDLHLGGSAELTFRFTVVGERRE